MKMEFSSLWARMLENLGWPEICFSLFIFFSVHHFLSQRHKAIQSWPLLGMLPSLLLNVHRLFEWTTDALNESRGTWAFHGPVFAGMEIVATSDPRNLEYILKTNFDNFPKGEEFRGIFSDLMGDGIFNSDSDSWRRQRKMANTIVHSKSFRQFMSRTTRDIITAQLLPVLSHFARAGGTFDLQDVLLRFTFDSTCTAVFGESANSLSKDLPDVPFGKAMDEVMESIMYRYVLPKKWWHLLCLLNLGKERQLAKSMKVIKKFVSQQLINAKHHHHHASGGSLCREDLLSAYVSVSDDEAFLRDSAINFLVAGRDTSGTALSWFFWLLSLNPHVERKILQEQKTILEKNPRDHFETEDLNKMVYLHAALCESLRLYPSVPMGQKGVVKEDVLPSGMVVRPGTILLYSIYSVGRMNWVWGEDCLEFKPERWLDCNEGGVRLAHESSGFRFLAFNGGPRTCVGKDMALVQMKLAAAEILLNFEVEVVEGHRVSPKASVIMTMKTGLMVKAKEKPKRCLSM